MKRLLLTLASAAILCTHAPAQPPAQTSTPAKPPARVRTQLQGFDLSPQTGKSANQVGGASRDLGTPRLFAPSSGKAFSTTPVFYWGTAQAGDKVTFKLTAMNGETLCQVSSTAGHFKDPDDAPSLQPGASYRWTIIPENDMLGGAPQPATFVIVTGPERDAISKEWTAAGRPSDKSMVFVNHRVWYDALDSYSETLDLMPSDQTARAGRATLYDSLPVTKELAEADWRMVH